MATYTGPERLEPINPLYGLLQHETTTPLDGMLKKNGGRYSKGPDWQSHVVVAGNLITGQNPASSEAAANALLTKLGVT